MMNQLVRQMNSAKFFLLVFVFNGVVQAQQVQTANFIIEFKQQALAAQYEVALKSAAASNSKEQLVLSHQNFIEKLTNRYNKTKALFKLKHEYYYALNGMALSLTDEQANWVRKQPEVKSITLEKIHQLDTDIGPEWIGASNVWNGLALDTPGKKGEGIVVGIIDTGI
ncbi:MAG TPA: hypothetical protein ENJ41_01195, partial [Oceanospirillales bacterium]|nr:hypothetical protein [Oceanospirillales bacterium]